ncbi:hypothetical protein MMC25_003825 [Agyrium rufum]|nr:hypothetical protein [Agyrium rufum]
MPPELRSVSPTSLGKNPLKVLRVTSEAPEATPSPFYESQHVLEDPGTRTNKSQTETLPGESEQPKVAAADIPQQPKLEDKSIGHAVLTQEEGITHSALYYQILDLLLRLEDEEYAPARTRDLDSGTLRETTRPHSPRIGPEISRRHRSSSLLSAPPKPREPVKEPVQSTSSSIHPVSVAATVTTARPLPQKPLDVTGEISYRPSDSFQQLIVSTAYIDSIRIIERRYTEALNRQSPVVKNLVPLVSWVQKLTRNYAFLMRVISATVAPGEMASIVVTLDLPLRWWRKSVEPTLKFLEGRLPKSRMLLIHCLENARSRATEWSTSMPGFSNEWSKILSELGEYKKPNLSESENTPIRAAPVLSVDSLKSESELSNSSSVNKAGLEHAENPTENDGMTAACENAIGSGQDQPKGAALVEISSSEQPHAQPDISLDVDRHHS